MKEAPPFRRGLSRDNFHLLGQNHRLTYAILRSRIRMEVAVIGTAEPPGTGLQN